MGYESKLYVVEKSNIKFPSEEKRYCMVIAMFDLCKFYPLSMLLNQYPDTDCYFYADDGDTQVLEDKYGSPLKEIPIDDVVEILECDLDNGSEYRRIYPLLAMLKDLQNNNHRWGELVILHYGY